jgi:multidrug efflux pump subunit AcrB
MTKRQKTMMVLAAIAVVAVNVYLTIQFGWWTQITAHFIALPAMIWGWL